MTSTIMLENQSLKMRVVQVVQTQPQLWVLRQANIIMQNIATGCVFRRRRQIGPRILSNDKRHSQLLGQNCYVQICCPMSIAKSFKFQSNCLLQLFCERYPRNDSLVTNQYLFTQFETKDQIATVDVHVHHFVDITQKWQLWRFSEQSMHRPFIEPLSGAFIHNIRDNKIHKFLHVHVAKMTPNHQPQSFGHLQFVFVLSVPPRKIHRNVQRCNHGWHRLSRLVRHKQTCSNGQKTTIATCACITSKNTKLTSIPKKHLRWFSHFRNMTNSKLNTVIGAQLLPLLSSKLSFHTTRNHRQLLRWLNCIVPSMRPIDEFALFISMKRYRKKWVETSPKQHAPFSRQHHTSMRAPDTLRHKTKTNLNK